MPARPRIVQVRHIAGATETTRELRKLRGVSRATAYRWMGEPEFPAPFKVLKGGKLYDLSHVRAWLAEHKTPEGL